MSIERKVLQPEESSGKRRGQDPVGFVHQWGVWSAEVGRHARGAGGEAVLGAGVRHSTHGKGHEEGGSTYAKVGSSLRNPPGNS